MSFSPKNPAVYTNAVAGFLAGRAAAGAFDPTPGDQSFNAQMADAFAQQVDAAFAALTNAAPNAFQVNTIHAASLATWANRSPLPSGQLTPGNYAGPAGLVAALAVQGNTQITNQGVDPNAGAGIPTFVFQPGGVASGNTYTTWASLMTAVSAVAGQRWVLIDDTIAAAHVPAGTWAVDHVTFSANFEGNAILFFDPGAVFTFTQLWIRGGLLFQQSASATGPVFTATNGFFATIDLTGDATRIASSGSTPWGQVNTGASGGMFVFLKDRTSIGGGGHPAFSVGAGSTLNIDANSQLTSGATCVAPHALAGSGTAVVNLGVDAGGVGAPQDVTTLTTNFSGVASQMAYTPAVSANWNNSNPTSVANALDRIAAKSGPIT